MQPEGKWYWSLKTHKVVPAGVEKLEDLLGPYDTADEAAGALDKVKARNEQLAAEEEAELAEELADLSPAEREEKLAEAREKRKFGGQFGF